MHIVKHHFNFGAPVLAYTGFAGDLAIKALLAKGGPLLVLMGFGKVRSLLIYYMSLSTNATELKDILTENMTTF